jgi:hypothetical protein
MNLINEFMNPNSVLRQGQVLSHALGMKASGTEIQRLIDPMILQRMCVASYALNKGQTPEADIDGWRLVGSTPTVLCYLKHGVSVVAVRGTASMDDWLTTNTTIPLNQLADTKRAQTMIKEVEKWKHSRPNETQWFATGHSLGGALCDVLLREKLVREAFTFNPAVQPQDFNGKLPNRRVYARGDPLYQLMGQFTVGAVLLPAKDFLTELRYRVLGEGIQDYLNQHDLSSFTDAPQSALVGNAKKQPKKPKQPKPRLPIQRGPNLQLMQDLFARLQAQREPDREMDDLTREMDQIIPKDKTPAPPPPSPPSGDGKLYGGVNQKDLTDAILNIIRYSEAKLYPETIEDALKVVVSSFALLLKSATFAEKRRINDYLDEIVTELDYFKGKEGNILKQARITGITIPLLQRIAKYLQGLKSEEWYSKTGTIRRDDVAESLTEERRDAGRVVADKEAKKGLTIKKGKQEIEEEAEAEIERGSPIKSPKKEFLGKGLSGGVSRDHLEEAVGYYEMKMPSEYSVGNLEQSMKVIQTVIKYIGRSATYDEKRRLQIYYDFINEELSEYNDLTQKEKLQRFPIIVKRLNDFTSFLYSLKPPASENPKKNLIADEIKEDAEVKRRTAEYEARLQKKKEADEKLKKEFLGKARPATFQYSREDLTTKQKAAERAAYYRKHPAEKPKRTKAKEVEVESVEPAKPVKFDEPTLAERARLTRAKETLRKGIVRRLFRKSAEIRLWIYLYKKGSYFNSTELKTKEREAYDVGRGLFTKNEWDEASKQTTDISNGKWKDYISDNVHDRISKQVATIKARLQKENDEMIENGPTADRAKKLPELEGATRMMTPNGYEWYVEDGKVFDLGGSLVGRKGMAAFKNIREI